MTDRSDIEPVDTRTRTNWRRLSYTRHCGWVDWGHALPGGPLTLKAQLDGERNELGYLDAMPVTLNGADAFVVLYGQAMSMGPVTSSTARHWVVRKGLSAREKAAVGLAIYAEASHAFESMQNAAPYRWVTSSGYSQEDLVSNLLGFYGAFRTMTQDRQRRVCGEVSVAESYRIWDAHIGEDGLGARKNRTFSPVYYPTDEGEGEPAFPAQFRTITPAREGADWVRPEGRFIDGRLVNSATPINVTGTGALEVRRRAPVR